MSIRRDWSSVQGSTKSIQGIHWLTPNLLVSFHIMGIVVLWKFTASDPLADTPGCLPRKQILNMVTSAVPRSCAFHEDSWLFVGDTRGSIAMFSSSDLFREESLQSELKPHDIIHKVHQKEHVTGIVFLPGKQLLLSVGNDGCLHECYIDETQKMKSALSISNSSLTGISDIWCLPNHPSGGSDGVILAGYLGNTFAMVDAASGHELFHSDTGGRQRRQDSFLDVPRGSNPSSFGNCGL